MKTCKHTPVERRIPHEPVLAFGKVVERDTLPSFAYSCSKCGAREIPLGKANDKHVGGVPAAGMLAVEVRAHDLAVAYEHDGEMETTNDESAGWMALVQERDREHDETAPYLAGWLGALIYGHVDPEPAIDEVADAADMAEVEQDCTVPGCDGMGGGGGEPLSSTCDHRAFPEDYDAQGNLRPVGSPAHAPDLAALLAYREPTDAADVEPSEAILPEPFEEPDDQSARDALTAGDGVIDGGL